MNTIEALFCCPFFRRDRGVIAIDLGLLMDPWPPALIPWPSSAAPRRSRRRPTDRRRIAVLQGWPPPAVAGPWERPARETALDGHPRVGHRSWGTWRPAASPGRRPHETQTRVCTYGGVELGRRPALRPS